jgi:hypothetical protein
MLPLRGLQGKLKLKLNYDRNQSASLSWCWAPIWSPRPDFFFCLRTAGFLLCGALSYERMGLKFTRTIASGPCQSNHSGVQVSQNSDRILPSHLRLPQPGGPGPRIYIIQEQGGPVIPPGTEFPFHCLLRLAGYSNSPPHRFCMGS